MAERERYAARRNEAGVVKRREFSRAQKAQMLKRASDEKGNIFCEGCGLNITGKAVEFDHTIPEAMVIDKTKALTIEDGKALGRDCCHRAPGGKTAQDLANIAKAKRREAKHAGIRPPSQIKSRGFAKSEPQRRASSPLSKQLPARRLP
jgi:hypothetical protein